MRWLIFLDTDHVSGPARLALDFGVQARRLGHEVLMLGLVRAPRPGPTLFSEACEAAGLSVRLLHERARFDPRVLAQFKAVLASFRPDIYQSHGYKGSLLGHLARRRGVGWQAVFHGFTWENARVRLYHRLDLALLRRADEVLTVSPAFKQILLCKGIKKDRLRWLPNAISEESLRASGTGGTLRHAWCGSNPSSAILVGMVGRFSPEKAPDLFLRAFSRAAERRPGLQAVMIGDGPMRAECEALAGALPAGDRAIFAGFRPDVASVYEALDLLVISSRSEGMPTVLLEALQLGVPVISTRVGAVEAVVRDGREALLAPVGDVEALAEAIGKAADDADLRRRLAEAGRERVQKHFSVEQRARTLLEHASCILLKRSLPEEEWNE